MIESRCLEAAPGNFHLPSPGDVVNHHVISQFEECGGF